MEITPQCVVALTWTLQDTLGEELDVLDEPVEFLLGGNDLLARIEQALQGHRAGASVSLHLEPEEAFDDYKEELLFLEPRDLFPADLQEGMVFEAAALPLGCSAREAGTGALPMFDVLYTVTDIYPSHVVLDGNHPLAGMALRLALTVHGVRYASAEESERGTAGTGFFRLSSSASAHP